MNATDDLPTTSEDGTARREPERPRMKGRVDHILDAATDLIADRGVDALTIGALADRAGVPSPAIYDYFPSARSIFKALLERYIAEMRVATHGHLTPCRTAAEARAAVRGSTRAFWEFVQCHPAYAIAWSAALADPEFAEILVDASRRNGEVLLQSVGPALDESKRSMILMFMVSYMSGATARFADLLGDGAGAELLIEAFIDEAVPGMLGIEE